jgi:hypothetical protein
MGGRICLAGFERKYYRIGENRKRVKNREEKTMKTFADIKRRIASGETIVMTWHKLGAPKLIGVLRKAEKVQTNAVMFSGGSWLYWGKAADYRIDGENEFTVMREGIPLMTYKFTE